MKINKHKIYALIGSNGCGKTTFINQLFQKHYQEEIFYVHQNNYLIDNLNIIQNLEFCNYDFNDNINTLFNIDVIGKLYPNQLSTGQKQIVSIICALYAHKELIIFDETMNALSHKNIDIVFDILHHYVLDNDASIIIVTHQQDIVNQCDEIIEYHEHLQLDIACSKKQNQKISFKQILAFMEREWFKKLLFTIILAFSFLFVFVAIYHQNLIYGSLNEQISQHLSNEIFIMNNSDIYHPNYGNYEIESTSIDNEIYGNILSYNNILSLDTFIPFTINVKRDNDYNVYYDDIYIYNNDKKTNISLDINSMYNITPYTSYSLMDDSLQYETSHSDGIVLTHDFFEYLGLSVNNLENYQIEMNISIPISQEPIKMITYVDDSEKEYDGRDIIYKEITLKFYIRGILADNASFQARLDSLGYLPIDYMNDLFSQYNEDYIPNAYLAQIKDINEVSQIKNDIESLSSTLECYSVYDIYKVDEIVENFLKSEKFISTIPGIFIAFIMVYNLFISFNKRKELYIKLISYKYNKQTCIQWIMKRYMIDYILFVLMFIVFDVLCYQILAYLSYPSLVLSFGHFAVTFILITLLPIGVDIHVVHKQYPDTVG